MNDTATTVKRMLQNFVADWHKAQKKPENPLASRELFAGIGGKGGMSAKESRKHGRSQPLVEDMGRDSDRMYRWLKHLGEIDQLAAAVVVYWAENGCQDDLDIAHTKYCRERGSIDEQRFKYACLRGFVVLQVCFIADAR